MLPAGIAPVHSDAQLPHIVNALGYRGVQRVEVDAGFFSQGS
jgi:hypothetical protein